MCYWEAKCNNLSVWREPKQHSCRSRLALLGESLCSVSEGTGRTQMENIGVKRHKSILKSKQLLQTSAEAMGELLSSSP